MRYAALIVLIPCAQRYALALRVYNVFVTLALLFKPQFIAYVLESNLINMFAKQSVKEKPAEILRFMRISAGIMNGNAYSRPVQQ